MKIVTSLMLCLIGLPAAAAPAAVCVQECSRQGNVAQCLTHCERNPRGGDFFDRLGEPRPPYLETAPEPELRQRGRPAPPRLDPRCLEECRYDGYPPASCRKQCRY